MTELRKIRKKISMQLKDMSPEEQVSFINKGAREFENEFGLNLPRAEKSTTGTGKLTYANNLHGNT